MRYTLIVAGGGALGALARYGLLAWLTGRLGTGVMPLLLINVSGAFALGFLATLADGRGLIGPETRLLLTTGFLSAYTTFSSWMYDTALLLTAGEYGRAAANVIGSVAAGLVAVALGIAAARWL